MFRSPRALALRAAAVVVAALTARTVALDLRSIHAQAHALGPLRAEVVASHTLREGEIVGRDDLRTVRRHAGELPPGTLDSPGRAIGRPVTVDVAPGAPVLAANVGAPGAGTSGALAPDERALRVVDAGGLVPDVGAIVDVYATFGSATGAATGGDAQLVARGARVLRVDHASSDITTGRGSGGATTGIELIVKASEAADVASAVADGVVTVVIAPVDDAH